MTAEEKQMIEYILQRIRKPSLIIDENTPLVSSGLVDSMALGDLVLDTRRPNSPAHPAGKDETERLGHGGQDVCYRGARWETAEVDSSGYYSGFAGVPGFTPECFLACAISSRTLSFAS